MDIEHKADGCQVIGCQACRDERVLGELLEDQRQKNAEAAARAMTNRLPPKVPRSIVSVARDLGATGAPGREEEGRCQTRCDHGSQCVEKTGHGDRHTTEHHCICYDLKQGIPEPIAPVDSDDRIAYGDPFANQSLALQVERLARCILENHPDAITEGGAVDVAIKLLEGFAKERREAPGLADAALILATRATNLASALLGQAGSAKALADVQGIIAIAGQALLLAERAGSLA